MSQPNNEIPPELLADMCKRSCHGTTIDLSMPLHAQIPCYPGDPPFCTTAHVDFTTQHYRVTHLKMGSHSGTHVEVPAHFLEAGETLDAFPCARFIGPAVVIDAPKAAGENVSLADIAGVDIQDGDIVLFRTGWEVFAGSPRFFSEHWPGIVPEVVESLVARGVKMIGGDFASIDSPSALDVGAPAHHAALCAGIPIVEGLINLQDIIGQRVFFIGLPLRIVGGEASPIRAAAITRG